MSSYISAYTAHIVNDTNRKVQTHLEIAGTIDWGFLGETCSDHDVVLSSGAAKSIDMGGCCAKFFRVEDPHGKLSTAKYDTSGDACRGFVFVISEHLDEGVLQVEEIREAGLEGVAILAKEVGQEVSEAFLSNKMYYDGVVGYKENKKKRAATKDYRYTEDFNRKSSDDLRLTTLNFVPANLSERRWYDVGATANVWYTPHRLGRFRDILRDLNPDIFGLQEISPDRAMPEGLRDLAGKISYDFTRKNLTYRTGLSNPVLYKSLSENS